MKRNPHLARLKSNYLFPEITGRKKQFLLQNPDADIISLGIGDTTEPIPRVISDSLILASANLGIAEKYSGYGPEQGIDELRRKIAAKIYDGKVNPDEVFISDGAKCDIGRLQILFGHAISIAVQDPAYPVYIDGSIIQGVKEIISMPCTPENGFFPDLTKLPRTDLIYFCSPNNPTGAVANRQQLEQLVAFAKQNHSLIIFDSAYATFIQDASLPKSIYEIAGAKEVAIEVNSFSKLAGFTGIRLGWTVVPEELKYEDGTSVKSDWNRLTSTIFNGASNIAQLGGCAVLEDIGLQQIDQVNRFYLVNAQILRDAFEKLGYEVFGGKHAPYLWIRFKGQKSWDKFQHFLEKYHLLTTPGSGFGKEGEGFIRVTAFNKRKNILAAVERLLNPI
jgi:LL-diaminopimelate aminotransferase